MATMKILVIGGGGGGGAGDSSGYSRGGGGGGGGYQYDASHSVSPTSSPYTISVGTGGAARANNSTLNGGAGGNSIFDTITAYGGGGGGYANNIGSGGGCGGGGGDYGGAGKTGGTGTQGGNGGSSSGFNSGAGGGGGAGGNGGSPGAGGVGTSNSITGSAVTYAVGGPGATSGSSTDTQPGAGGKGGGAGASDAGLNGIVIISYVTADFGVCTATGAYTKTTSGANTIFTFTGAGTFTVVANPPTVTNSAATSVGGTSAQGNGNVTSDGGGIITERGFVWATHSSPTKSDNYVTVSGTTGAYSGTTSGLNHTTTYYYRAYAINSAGTSYSSDQTFTTTAVAPTVTDSAADTITYNSALGHGNVTDDGGSAITERGVCWSTSANPTTSDSKQTAAGTTGAYSASMTPLSPNTLYHYRSYAINSIGTSYGNDLTFTTLIGPPTSTSSAPSSVTINSAIANANITSLGGDSSCIKRGIVWDTVSHALPGNVAPASSGYANNISESGTFYVSSFTESMVGLAPATTYYYRSFTQNSLYYSYGNEISFNTESITYLELQCQASISDYKWLSATLKTSQQQQAVRPYFECRIVDDSVVPSTLSNPGSPTNGSVCSSPDGDMLAVGLYGGNISFWKGAPAVLSGAPTTAIESGSANNVNSLSNYSIKCSDWIAGSFKIDVYYFYNWTNGDSSGVLKVKHWYSMDKGATWSSSQTVSATLIPYNQAANIWIAGGKPYLNSSGDITSTVFYLGADTYASTFSVYWTQATGASNFNPVVVWNSTNVNSLDWNLHSFDTEYINGEWYVSFSGYHKIIDAVNNNTLLAVPLYNYSIYLVKAIDLASGGVWSSPSLIMSALSTSTQNQNSFMLPSLFWDGLYLWILFQGRVVTSVSSNNGQSTTATSINYFLAKSSDLLNFNYPVPIVFSGANFTDASALAPYSFFLQGGKYWLAGNGQLGSFTINNIVADISNDVISYEAMDTQQNPSTLQITVGNQNGKWRGASPTENGYQAIAGNKKVCLFQGYYNSNGVPELAPKNTFFIDDIHQNISANTNDFQISARDLYKSLSVLTTQFSFNYTGIKKYIDLFDGTTLSNWNQVSGTWTEGVIQGNSVPNTLIQTDVTALKNWLITLSLYQQVKPNAIFSVAPQLPDPITSPGVAFIYMYFYYVDSDNWMRLKIDTSSAGGNPYAFTIQKCLATVVTTVSTGTFPSAGAHAYFPFLFVRTGFFNFNIYVGDSSSLGNSIGAFNSPTLLWSGGIATYGFKGLATIGLGGYDTILYFKNFKYFEFDASLNISELIKTIATKASIFDYKLPTTFTDYFFNGASNYTSSGGAFTLANRIMSIPAGVTAEKTDLQFSDAEIKFTANLSVTSGATSLFSFYFRANIGLTEGYLFTVQNSAGVVSVSLSNIHSSTPYTMAYTQSAFLLDFSKYHSYKVIFFNGYIFMSIDGEIVYAWFDNNSVSTPASGYMAFKTGANSLLKIKDVSGNGIFTQLQTVSINPGDDLQNSVSSLLDTARAYFFSDLMGRLKVAVLNSSDTPNYLYQGQVTVQQVDNSDKEYANQVTVIGSNGIQAIAQDLPSISTNNIVRNKIIEDYTITTYADALARANLELVNFKKYINQYNPQQIINVGSEIYDAVTIINTGSNTSNVNQNVRNYSQDMQVGGSKLGYWMTIETGLL